MRLTSFLLILLTFQIVEGAAETLDCTDAKTDLTRARYYRDGLKSLSESEGTYVGEDYLLVFDHDGRLLTDAPFKIVDRYTANLRRLTGECKVPPQKLGFGMNAKQPIDHLERLALRHLIKKRTEILSNSTHFQTAPTSKETLSEVEQALLKVGMKPAVAEAQVAKLKTEILANQRQSLEFAQKISPPETCTPKDFRDKLPPIRDQASAALCFAYAAADMASFKTGKAVSALGVALAYYKKVNEPDSFEKFLIRLGVSGDFLMAKQDSMSGGGFIDDAFNAANESGLCLDKNFGASSRPGAEIFAIKERDVSDLRQSNSEFTLLAEVERISALSSSAEKQAALVKLSDKTACTANGQTYKNQFGSASLSDLSEVIQASSPREVLFKFYDRVCAPEKLAVKEKVERVEFERGDKKGADALNAELDKGNIAGIHYYAEALRSPRVKAGGYHASTVVGRRLNKGVCEFLVRNSWNADCSKYNAVAREIYDCEGGHLWVPADSLIKNTKGVLRYTN